MEGPRPASRGTLTSGPFAGPYSGTYKYIAAAVVFVGWGVGGAIYLFWRKRRRDGERALLAKLESDLIRLEGETIRDGTYDPVTYASELLSVRVHQLDPASISEACLIKAAEWLFKYTSLKSCTTQANGEKRQADLERAWQLLTAAISRQGVLAGEAVLWGLDLAQRVNCPLRLGLVVDTVLRRGQGAVSDPQLVATFTAACLLGRWGLVRSLGAGLVARGCVAVGAEGLYALHTQAEQEGVIDYQVLYELAEAEAAQHGDADPATLRFDGGWRITEHSLRFRSSLQAEANQAFDPDGAREWQTYARQHDAQEIISVFGALAHMWSRPHTAFCQPMVGPASSERIEVCGFTDLTLQAGKQVRQTETCSMHAVEGDRWEGEYTVMHKDRADGRLVQKVVFDVRMTLHYELRAT